MTTMSQLNHWMRKDASYVGTFSMNRIPHLPPRLTSSFIVNTDSHNLPGQHWIAVRMIQDHAWIFDPLAYPPPPTLCQHLLFHCHIRVIHICSIPVQPRNTVSCGQHCIYFLYVNLPAPSEYAVHQFVSAL